MTKEELVKKYPFLEDTSQKNLKKLIMFILFCIMEVGLKDKDEKKSLDVFLDDIRNYL